MDNNQIKKLLMPIIKECVRETLTQEGLIATIVSEAVKGALSAQAQVLLENVSLPKVNGKSGNKKIERLEEEQENEFEKKTREKQEEMRLKQRELKKKVLNKTGLPGKMFEGLEPEEEPVEISQEKEIITESVPRDVKTDNLLNSPGMDISNIAALAGGAGKWKKILHEMKE